MRHSIISDQINQELERACIVAKEQGYEEIELHNVFGKSIEECSDEEAYKIKSILDTYGLTVSNIASTIFFMCPLKPHYKLSMFNSEFHCIEGDVQNHLNYLKRAAIIADILNCDKIRVFPFRFPDNEEIEVVGTIEDMECIVNNLKLACEIASEYNKTIVLENCPYSHCPKGEMTKQLHSLVNHDNMMLLWDPANSYRAEKNKVPNKYTSLSLIEEFELIKNTIGHIHFKNYEYVEGLEKPFVHKTLMSGDIDYSLIVDNCRSIEQDVCISLEPEVAFKECIQSMKELKGII